MADKTKARRASGGHGDVRGSGQSSYPHCATKSGESQQVFFAPNGRPVATLCGGTLKKRVRGSVHQLRRPPAWAVDVAILEAARRDGARTIEITDIETGRVYRAQISAFNAHGVRLDRGHGVQVALPLAHWQVEEPGIKQLVLALEV